jgi:hypothetical protein
MYENPTLEPLSQRLFASDGGQSHFRFEACVWFRRGRLVIVPPVRHVAGRFQAKTPFIPLFSFPEPALSLPGSKPP